MLSIYTLKSASEASRYYASGDYYVGTQPLEQSQWLGQGALELKLEGMVAPELFHKLLSGYLPNGVVMQQVQKGYHHRPGYDLTFSAPKSVSLLALVLGNQAILEAHREAVKETLLKIEQKYAAVRNKHQGVITPEKTGNFLMALFEEYDSRAGDPHLHHHAVILNMTLKQNGTWRTLYFDEIYQDKLINGLEYRAALSKKLMALGYELNFKPGGLFEIKGIPEALLQHFSKRSTAIKHWLEDHEASGGLAAQVANFETRDPKSSISLEERLLHWLKGFKETEFSTEILEKTIEKAHMQGPVSLPDPRIMAEHAVQMGIEHCYEKSAFFRLNRLIQTARRLSLVPVSQSDCLHIIQDKILAKDLSYVGEGILTSSQYRLQEKTIVESMLHAQKTVAPIIAKGWVLDCIVERSTAESSQRQVLKFLLRNADRQVLVQAPSKAFLKETLALFNQRAQEQRFYPCFLTERFSQIEPLKRTLQTERVLSVEAFLLVCESRIAAQNPSPGRFEQWVNQVLSKKSQEVWVVASPIGITQLERLQGFAEVLHARLILTQSGSLELPFMKTLNEHGISSITLETPPGYEASLNHQERVLRRLERLERVDKITEREASSDRILEASQRFVQSEAKQLVTLRHSERIASNESIRALLKAQDSLKGPSLRLQILEPLSLSKLEKTKVASYQPNDVIRFPTAPQGRHFGGEYKIVQSVDLKEGVVILQTAQGTLESWDPKQSAMDLKKITVFKVSSRELLVGDIIRWNQSHRHPQDKRFDRIRHQAATVVSLDPNAQTFSVRLQNAKCLTLSSKAYADAHWDHGYAILLKQTDLEKPESSIVLLQSSQVDKSTLQDLSVLFQSSQTTKVSFQVVTDSIQSLKERIGKVCKTSPRTQSSLEVPYEVSEALAHHQTLATQPLLHGLQKAALEVLDFNPEFLKEPLQLAKPLEATDSVPLRLACNAVDRVCLHYTERDSVFSLKQAQYEALILGQGTLDLSDIEGAFSLALESGWLIKVGENAQQEPLITTQHIILLEKLCTHLIDKGKGVVKPLFGEHSETIKTIQADSHLTAGQKEAVALLLTSPDRVNAVQGIAGVGKTTALKTIQQYCVERGFEPLVLADTSRAKEEAKQVSGMVSMTTAQFLTCVETLITQDLPQAKALYGKHALIILDEASMVSSQDFFRLQKIVKVLDVRLGLIGDFKQQDPIGPGLEFESALAYGIRHAVMKENVRLKSEQAFEVMNKVYAGDIQGSLKGLHDRIEEIPIKKEALNRITDLYMEVLGNKNEAPLVIIPLNKDRMIVNSLIHEKLKETQRLKGEPVPMPVLLPVDRRVIEKQDIQCFQKDEIIRFNRALPRLGVQAGDYYQVMDIDREHHRLSLARWEPHLQASSTQKQLYWSPKDLEKPAHIEIYKLGTRALMAQESIVFKRNIAGKEIFNGSSATVLEISPLHLKVQLSDKKVVSLDLREGASLHLDYGYALTVRQSQGRTIPYVITYGESPKPLKRLESQLKVGDWVTLPKTAQNVSKVRPLSQLVQVVSQNKTELILKGREGVCYQEAANPHRRWDHFPNPESRNKRALPLTTSQKAWLVQVSRGDYVFVVVANLRDFKYTLESKAHQKRSAQSYLDPKWPTLHQDVQRLVKAIEWRGGSKKTEKNQSIEAQNQEPSTEKKKGPRMDLDPKEHTLKGIDLKNQSSMAEGFLKNPLDQVVQWLGLPKHLSEDCAFWQGGLSVTIKGPNRGHWKHWGSGKHGQDLASLEGAIHPLDPQEAVKALPNKASVEALKIELPQPMTPVVQQNRVQVRTDRSAPLKSQDQISVLRQALEEGKSSKSMAATGPASQKDAPKMLSKTPKKDIELER